MKRYRKSIDSTSAMLNALGIPGLDDWGQSVPLDSLKPIQSLKIDKFLALLNHVEMKPAYIASRLQQLSALPRIVNYTRLPSTGEVLRTWIDEWVDSGKTNNGDEPRTRSLEKAKNAANAAYEFSKRGRILLLPDGNSLGLWIATYDPEPISTLRPLVGPRPEDYAREHLVFFLLSELRYRLAKCRSKDCGKYFLLTHTNRLYKRGTLCESCQRRRSQDSAKASTANERKDLRLALHIEAARRFGKQIRANAYWYENDAIKTKITGVLNAKFGEKVPFRTAYPNGITGKWLANAKNWKPIEEAAKGGK